MVFSIDCDRLTFRVYGLRQLKILKYPQSYVEVSNAWGRNRNVSYSTTLELRALVNDFNLERVKCRG
jgi:hypothetical protein